MKRKFVVLLFTLEIIMFSGSVMAGGSCAPQNDATSSCLWEYDSESKTLTITGSGRMDNYRATCTTSPCSTNAPWFQYSIEKVSIGEGITSVGNNAFTYHAELKNVQLPETLTEIKGESFHGCTALKEINLPSGLLSIEERAFSMAKLGTVVIPDSVKTISTEAFRGFPGQGFAAITTIYCSEKQMEQCKKAVESQNIIPILYKKNDKNEYTVQGKTFASLEDLAVGKYIPKRIYTISEANEATGKKNRVMLKYK